MPLPMDLLISAQDNVYELTCAIIRRALQVTVTGDEEVDKQGGKVVSTAINQVLTKKVEFRLEE